MVFGTRPVGATVLSVLLLTSIAFAEEPGEETAGFESLREIVECTWGGEPVVRQGILIDPPLEIMRGEYPLAWPTRPDGTVWVYGTDEERVWCAREIARNRRAFTPVIERMVREALADRRVWELDLLGSRLVGLIRTPSAFAVIARMYLGVHELLDVLPAELAAADRVEPWARRCGIGYWKDPMTWDRRLDVMGKFWKLEGESLKVITDSHWRSERVVHAALETLARPPKILDVVPVDEATGDPKFQDRLEAMHRNRMQRALEYLSEAYQGETRVRDALRDVCHDPQSAVAQIGVPDTDIRKALRRLGR